jgi:hypothetical protein
MHYKDLNTIILVGGAVISVAYISNSSFYSLVESIYQHRFLRATFLSQHADVAAILLLCHMLAPPCFLPMALFHSYSFDLFTEVCLKSQESDMPDSPATKKNCCNEVEQMMQAMSNYRVIEPLNSEHMAMGNFTVVATGMSRITVRRYVQPKPEQPGHLRVSISAPCD